MSIWRNRRFQVVGVSATLALVAAIGVVALTGDEHDYDAPVTASSASAYPTRGSLAADTDMIESAADVWRSGEHHRLESVPTGEIELLWAGEVDADSLEGYVAGEDTPETVRVVVLRSGTEAASFADGEFDGRSRFSPLGLTRVGNFEQDYVRAPGNIVLVSKDQPNTAEVVDDQGTASTVTADDGLVTVDGGVTALLVESGQPEWSNEFMPGIVFANRVLFGDSATIERIWDLMGESEDSFKAVRDALGRLLSAPREYPDARPKVSKLEILLDTASPLGTPLLALSASEGFSSGARSVVAIEFGIDRGADTGPDSDSDTQANSVVSERYLEFDTPQWVAALWIDRPGVASYLVVVGSERTVSLEVRVGRQSSQFAAPGGVLVTESASEARDRPPLVVWGTTDDGTVVEPLRYD